MLIHNRLDSSRANGPGNRAVIWTQGCQNMNCPGCWNPDTHAWDMTKQVDGFALLRWVYGIPNIEGVTFSGGEPFQQTLDLYLFCNALKRRRPELSIGAYTGYTLEELREGRILRRTATAGLITVGKFPRMVNAILDNMDFLVAGRYNEKLKCDDKPLCGSSNQQVHFLTDRYTAADLRPNTVEILIDATANVMQLTGFPSNANQLTAR